MAIELRSTDIAVTQDKVCQELEKALTGDVQRVHVNLS